MSSSLSPSAKLGILIFPAEAENAFEVFQALRFAPRFQIWGASSRPGYAALLFPHLRDDLPPISAPGFLDEFNRFLREKQISLIVPTHDDVALFLAQHASQLAARIVGSGLRCAEISREKRQLYTELAGERFCPRTYDGPQQVERWPVFAKPNRGQGGVGTLRLDDAEAWRRHLPADADVVVCEYLPGEEFTVDCFSDRHGQLRFIGPRSREVVRMGIAFVSRALPVDDETKLIAQALHMRFQPRGLWFFQTKRDTEGRLKLMEMSCRPAGTMSVYRQLGVNLPLLAVFDALDFDVEILKNDLPLTVRRRLHSSYDMAIEFDTVYVDYDDTIVIDGKVNAQLMQFLYQCRNRQKTLVLLTKHAGDLAAHMARFCVPVSLFHQVWHLRPGDRKSEFMTEARAILIDNLFSERRDALLERKIPVFDVDAVESLLI